MARKVPGVFVPCDVNLADDPAIMHAGYRAELLFRRANEWAKRLKRDGIIYPVELPRIAQGIPGNPQTHADALIDAGLWVSTEEGLVIRSFLKWNPSQAEQSEIREKRRIGAMKTNHRRGTHRDSPDTECPLCQEGATHDRALHRAL